MGGTILGVLNSIKTWPLKALRYLRDRLTVSVTVESQDDMFPYLQEWLYDQHFDRRQRRYLMRSRYITIDDHMPEEDGSPRRMYLAPYAGSYLFRRNKKWMWLRCQKNEPSMNKGSFFMFEKVTIEYLGTSKKHVQSLMDELMERYIRDHKEKAKIFTADRYNHWFSSNQPVIKRSPESVILNREVAMYNILKHVQKFKDDEAKYLQRGVPYHYGMLFTGPPGTGKTTVAYAIASHFNMSVYFMNVGQETSDEGFLHLVSSVPPNSIIMLEDIDTVFEDKREMKRNVSVSFSTIINALDGFCTKHGMIVIMTTNHPEKLDPALVRSGRVRFRMEFGNCVQDQLRRMFLKFFPGEEQYAKEFAEQLPDDVLSPAVVENFLMEYDDNPKGAAGFAKELLGGETQ